MIVDRLERASSYFAPAWWAPAAAFLAGADRVALGEHPILGDRLFARVMSLETSVDEAAAIIESHRTYADVHVVLGGAERIKVWDAGALTVRTPYDAGRDVMFYERPPAPLAELRLGPGDFAFFRPQDAHMPQLAVAAPGTIRKLVFKVALTLLEDPRP